MFHGHSSVTQTLTLVAQQLAQHRDIQKKMFAEMETVWPKDQKLTQEIVQQMKYFNAVFYGMWMNERINNLNPKVYQKILI